MKKMLTSFYFGLIGLMTFGLVSIGIFLILQNLSFISLEKGIVFKSYFNQLNFLFSLTHSPFFLSVFICVFIIFIGVFLVSILKILNPTFNLENLKNKKQYSLIFFKFILSLLGLYILFQIPEPNLGSTNFIFTSLELIALILIVLLIMFFILYWHRNGIIGDFSSLEMKDKITWKEKFKLIKNLSVSKISLFFKVLFFIIVCGVISFILVIWGISGLGLSSIISPESTINKNLKFLHSLVYSISIVGFIYLSLFYSFFENLKINFKDFIMKIIPVCILIIIAIVGIWRNDLFLEKIDYNKLLISETSINVDEASMYHSSILFTQEPIINNFEATSDWKIRKNPPESNLVFDNLAFSSYEPETVFIQCSENNIKKLEKLEENLNNKNFQSVLADEYYNIVRICYRSNWEIEKSINLSKYMFEKTNHIISGLLYTSAQSQLAQYNAVRVKEFKEFINSDKYHVGLTVRKRIIQMLIHYGEIEEAKKWHQGYEEDIENIEYKSLPYDGLISGNIIFNDNLSHKIKVGLFVDESPEKWGLPVKGVENKRLVASTDIEEGGSFSFNQVLEGEYYLGILIKEERLEKENIIVNTIVDEIKINSDNKDIKLEPINIKIK